jgi:copper chaperone NosL
MSALLMCCHTSPEEIPYGNAECTFCRMTVIDRQHACELVTDKGKVHFFDAIECMANYHHAHPDVSYDHILVNDFNEPGSLLLASEAVYLISPELPSPMGAFLAAFADAAAAQEAIVEYGGRVYDWNGILAIARQRKFGTLENE